MNSVWVVPLAVGVPAGMALGGAFFAGLWWTVHRGMSSTAPGLWFVASLLLRTGVVVCGLYEVGRGDWRRLPACLIGFWIVRSVVARLSRGTLRAAVSP